MSKFVLSQCPQLYDGNGILSSNPYWINCGSGNFTINTQADISFGAYTIDWGDGTPNTIGSSYTSPNNLTHLYSSTIDTFIVTLTTGTCTVKGVVVMENAVSAGIQIPSGTSLITCAPKALQFINASTNVSKTTKFTWEFGDGSPPLVIDYTNAGTTISHTYSVGTVNCQTGVKLTASNYCTFSSPSVVNYSPIKIYDKDVAQITAPVTTRCWPDNSFQFSNSTIRNCLSAGNTIQRYERWNFGDHWGRGYDSLVGWKTWPPVSPVTIAYIANGAYTVTLEDSSLCGIATKTLVVNVVNRPTSLITVSSNTVCQGSPITFTNSSTPAMTYNWNFDNTATYTSYPFGPRTYSYNTASDYTVSLITSIPGLNNFCNDTSQVPVSVKPKPFSNFTYTPLFGCDNSSVTFSDSSIGIINNWTWSFNNGNSSNNQVPPNQSYPSIGQYSVSLMVETNFGCKDSVEKIYNVYPSPVANFTVNTSCTGYLTSFTNTSTFSNTDPITTHEWDFGDGSAISNSLNPTHVYTTPGSYTITLTEKTAHCNSTKTTVLTINQKPTADYTASNYTVCPNALVSFTNTSVNGDAYIWNLGTGVSSNAVDTSETYINTNNLTNKTYTIELIASTTLGCVDTNRKTLIVNPAPKAQYTTNYTPKCAPTIITFTNTSIGGLNYIWNLGDSTSSNSTNATHTYSNTTDTVQTVNVDLIATNVYGCSDTITNPYLIYPEAIYNFVPVTEIGCSPKTIVFTTDSGGVNYLWEFGDGSLFSGSFNQSHTYINNTLANDTFNVRLMTTNSYNCKDTTYGQVIIKPSAKGIIGASTTSGCADLTVSFTNASTNAVSHQWDFGDGTTSTAIVPVHTFTNTNTFTQVYPVSLVVTSSNGCTDSVVTNIQVYPKPAYSFTLQPNDTVCSGITVSLPTTPGAISYQWSFGDGTLQSGPNPTHVFNTNFPLGTTYSISMTATSPYNCQNSFSTSIFVYPKPTANFSTNTTIGCAPLNASFNNSTTGANKYMWYFGDGGISSSINPSHVYQNLGAITQGYNAALVAIDTITGCKDSLVNIINVYPQAKYNFQLLPDSGCTPLSVNIPTAPGASSYVWDFGDGQGATGINPTHIYLNNTTNTQSFVIALIATNSFNCRDTIRDTVTVFPRANVSFAASPNSQLFPSATISISNTSSTGYNYAWNLGDGTTDTAYSPSPHTFTTWGSYSVTLVVSTAHCKDSLTQTITIIPPIPIADFSGNKTGCQPVVMTFTNNSIYGSSYLWDFGDGNTGSTVNPTHVYNTPGTYTVSLKVIGPGGTAVLNKNDSITVYAKPTAYFIANPILVYVPNDPVFFVNQSQNANNFTWDFGDGNSSTDLNPIHKYIVVGEYTVSLIAVSPDGCVDTFLLADKIRAEAVTGIEVPNAFTPNISGPSSDGIFDPSALNNDIFHPNLTGVVDYKLIIFNKWGETLFKTDNQNVGWDGYYKGKICQEDTYIYKIYAVTTDLKAIQKAGDFLLIR